MEDACGISPSLPPAGREVFAQADLFCFAAKVCFFSPPFFFPPRWFSICQSSLEKPSGAVTNKRSGLQPDPGTCPKAQATAAGALLGV